VPLNLLIIERLESAGSPFASPMISFGLHETAAGELFEMPSMRGYVLRMAGQGRTEPHEERFDRLMVAVTNLHLRDQTDEKSQSEINLKAGEVRWIPKDSDRAIVNLDDTACTFITIEFN